MGEYNINRIDSGNKIGAKVETPGIKAEAKVVEFLKEAFPDCITEVQKTSQFDYNDRNGVDCVVEMGGYRIAVDITFDSDKRRLEKMRRMKDSPMVQLHDPATRQPIGQRIPRILFFDRSMDFWIDYGDKAESEGLELTSMMSQADVNMKKKAFIRTVLDQAEGFSKLNPKYAESIAPVAAILKREGEKLEQQ